MGIYSEGQRVEVRYPLTSGSDRDEWPWLPGTIVTTDCDPLGREEYQVRVDVEELAEKDAEDDDALWFPACFRTVDELRPAEPTP